MPIDYRAIRQVAAQARAQLREDPGSPCLDLDCLAAVYAAGVAEALEWVLGSGPVPSGVVASSLVAR